MQLLLYAAMMNSKSKNCSISRCSAAMLRHLQEHCLDAYCPSAAALAPHILLSAVHFIPLSKWQTEAGAPLPVLMLAPKAEASDRAYLLLSLSSGRVMWSWPPAPMSWHCYDCWGETECWKRELAFQLFLLLHHVTKMKGDTAISLLSPYNLDTDF